MRAIIFKLNIRFSFVFNKLSNHNLQLIDRIGYYTKKKKNYLHNMKYDFTIFVDFFFQNTCKYFRFVVNSLIDNGICL